MKHLQSWISNSHNWVQDDVEDLSIWLRPKVMPTIGALLVDVTVKLA